MFLGLNPDQTIRPGGLSSLISMCNDVIDEFNLPGIIEIKVLFVAHLIIPLTDKK